MSEILSIALPSEPEAVRLRPEAGAWQSLVERALARARAEGVEEGRRTAAAELDRVVAAVTADTERSVDALAGAAVTLARSIAARIVRTEVDEGRYPLERIVRETLAASGVGRGEVSVHLHPSDAASLADIAFRQGTTIEADVEVPRGHVHVETPLGRLIRNVDEMLDAITERIREESGT